MGLQVWLPLNGNLDNQGLANVTVSNNGATVNTAGKIGKCYSFDGNSLYGDWSEINTLTQMSGCCWVYLNNLSSAQYFFHLGGQSSYPCKFSLDYEGSIRFQINGTEYISGITLTTGIWYHLAITWNGTMAKLYVNGIESYSKSATGSFSASNHFAIGARTNGTAGNTFAYAIKNGGKLNDIRFYDHALSPREVKQVSAALVLHYPLSMPGQENLYTGSRDFSGTWVNGANWVTDSEQYNGFVVKKKSSIWGGLAQNVPCSNGDVFTISFYAKVDSGGNILSIHRSSLGNVTTGLTILDGNFTSGTDWVTASQTATSWKKYWATVQITSTDITYLQWRIENSVANKFLYVCGMKLERGSCATPWLPNPADPEYSVLGFNNNIEYDVSGYGNNGTRNGTFSWSGDTPRYGTSTYVNSSSSIDHPRCLSNDDQEWTCCAWVKLDNFTSHQELNNFNKSNAVIHVTTPLMYLNEGANDYYMYGSQIVPVDEWTHIAFVFKNSTGLRNVYINGILKNNYGPNKTSTPYGIPDSVTLFGQNFAGYVSDYREYATCLSPQDIRDLYAVAASVADNGTLMASEVSEV